MGERVTGVEPAPPAWKAGGTGTPRYASDTKVHVNGVVGNSPARDRTDRTRDGTPSLSQIDHPERSPERNWERDRERIHEEVWARRVARPALLQSAAGPP